MKTIRTETKIDADISKVWNVLLNFDNYPNWNPFIKSISGEKVEGSTLSVFITPPGSNGMTFKPKVLNLDQNREFRWKGKLFISGLFDGEHYFQLKSLGDGQTILTHGESFSGILVPLMGSILKKSELGFELMNKALKEECEKI